MVNHLHIPPRIKKQIKGFQVSVHNAFEESLLASVAPI